MNPLISPPTSQPPPDTGRPNTRAQIDIFLLPALLAFALDPHQRRHARTPLGGRDFDEVGFYAGRRGCEVRSCRGAEGM